MKVSPDALSDTHLGFWFIVVFVCWFAFKRSGMKLSAVVLRTLDCEM